MTSILAIGSVGAFILLTLWDITVNGILEPPNLNADHFVSGAGEVSLVLRGLVGIGAIVSMLIWLPLQRKWSLVIPTLGATSFVIIVFTWSALGLERSASGYDEDKFNGLLERFSTGEHISAEQVRNVLGEPLVSGRQHILLKSRPHNEAWLYTYMPSCGFGWQKRVVYYDLNRTMADYLRVDEP